MFKATKPFKDTITGHKNEPSLRIGKQVPANAVNLAYYFNPTATESEKILTADPPRSTIDHRVETQYMTLLDQASGPNGEEPSNDLFPKSIYYSDEEGYYGRLNRQDETIRWYPENHVDQKAVSQDSTELVVRKGDESKIIEYADADGYKGNLYLDTSEYIVDATKDASTIVNVDFTVNNFELSYHKIFGSYVAGDDVNLWAREPNPTSNVSTLWPARIEVDATGLSATNYGSINGTVANYISRIGNPWDGVTETESANKNKVVTTSKPVGLLYFDKLEIEPAEYHTQKQDGHISEARNITGSIQTDEFNWSTTSPKGGTTYTNNYPTIEKATIDGQPITKVYQSIANEGDANDYSQIQEFINFFQRHNNGSSAPEIQTIINSIANGNDIAIWVRSLTFHVNDESIDMLVDDIPNNGIDNDSIDTDAEPSYCYFTVEYAFKVSDRGRDGTISYNVIACYKSIMLENGKSSLTRTIKTFKEVATRYKAICHYTGVVNRNWVDYDGIAYYMGSVVKGNSIGNQNPGNDNELLMFPDNNGRLRQIVEKTKQETNENNVTTTTTKYENYYRVEADSVYITDVFNNGKACFYKYKLKHPIYDYRGPDKDGFYKGDAIKLYTSTMKDIPAGYEHSIKLSVADYEDKTSYDQHNKKIVTQVPTCYYAELFTSFISSSTDTFKVVYNGYDFIDNNNKVLNSGIEEDVYNAPYMIKDVDYQMEVIDKRARLNTISILNYTPLKDDRRRITFKWKISAVNKNDKDAIFESTERISSVLNKEYALPCEYDQFEERGMIVSPKLNGDSIPASPADICLYDQAGFQNADDDYYPLIHDTNQFIYSVEITDITTSGSVNIKCNPDGSGYITAETTEDTGFYDNVKDSYTIKLDMENPYWVENGNIYKGYKVKCIDSRYIKVKTPRNEALLDSWYPLIQFGHYSRILDQYGAHKKVCYSMPEYDKQHYSSIYSEPYVDIKEEEATIINSHMIKTHCYPIYNIEPSLNIDTHIFNDTYFKVIKKQMTWKDAEAYCRKLGGHLAMPKDKETSDFIIELATQYKLNGLWLGGTDEAKEGEWRWADGTLVEYSNWNTGQPDNLQKEDYMETYTTGSAVGKWNDLSNTNINTINGFICEFTGNTEVYKVIDDIKYKLHIENISFSDGVILLKESISENDKIVVNYTYLEENYQYRGYWRNPADFVRIDLNPNIYHTYNNPDYLPSIVSPSKNLFNKVIYFFMKPSVEYNISADNDSLVYDPQGDQLDGEIVLENDNCLYHKIDDAEPNDDIDILVGSVYIRQNTSLHSTIITDARTRGGGVLESMSDSLRHELEPESDYYLDIGYYDGKPYQENGVIVVRLDNRILKEYGGRFTTGDVETKVKRWLGFGIYPIIEFVDSYDKHSLPQYTLEVEDSYANVIDITPEILLECVTE